MLPQPVAELASRVEPALQGEEARGGWISPQKLLRRSDDLIRKIPGAAFGKHCIDELSGPVAHRLALRWLRALLEVNDEAEHLLWRPREQRLAVRQRVPHGDIEHIGVRVREYAPHARHETVEMGHGHKVLLERIGLVLVRGWLEHRGIVAGLVVTPFDRAPGVLRRLIDVLADLLAERPV